MTVQKAPAACKQSVTVAQKHAVECCCTLRSSDVVGRPTVRQTRHAQLLCKHCCCLGNRTMLQAAVLTAFGYKKAAHAVCAAWQAIALSPEGNLWVAGQDKAALYNTDPFALGDDGNSFGIWSTLTNGVLALNIDTTDCASSSGLGNDTVDPCCVAGSFNGGIAISTGSRDVYISNECQIGKARAPCVSAVLSRAG